MSSWNVIIEKRQQTVLAIVASIRKELLLERVFNLAHIGTGWTYFALHALSDLLRMSAEPYALNVVFKDVTVDNPVFSGTG